ncbi:IS4 transposase (plasmid) [Nostoc flagelliforme CCNUN1]|uniref:IS4 transposase n=1 Tax=Nostoc flagelliforme CCNUN1 TaxID=2038116 RepID=A0A2K8T7A4_9NOSO|nr:IS4 transposase [Nostoc flagelliforme CCNUN1]
MLRERYEPRDLFDEVKPYINLVDGTLSAEAFLSAKSAIFKRLRWRILNHCSTWFIHEQWTGG